MSSVDLLRSPDFGEELHLGRLIRIYSENFESSVLYRIVQISRVISLSRRRRALEFNLVPVENGHPVMLELRQNKDDVDCFLWNYTHESYREPRHFIFGDEVDFQYTDSDWENCTKAVTTSEFTGKAILNIPNFVLYRDSDSRDVALLETSLNGLLDLYIGGAISESRIRVYTDDELLLMIDPSDYIEPTGPITFDDFLDLFRHDPKVRNLSLLAFSAIFLFVIALIILL